jgi:hypothetical protein
VSGGTPDEEHDAADVLLLTRAVERERACGAPLGVVAEEMVGARRLIRAGLLCRIGTSSVLPTSTGHGVVNRMVGMLGGDARGGVTPC